MVHCAHSNVIDALFRVIVTYIPRCLNEWITVQLFSVLMGMMIAYRPDFDLLYFTFRLEN